MATAIIMPKTEMAMESGTIVRWLKAPGDLVRRGEALLEIETDKLTMEVEAEAEGVLLAITRGSGEEVPVAGVIGYIGRPGEAAPAAASQGSAPPAGPPRVATPATPLARTVAAERGLDPAALRGTGPGGAVRARDVPPGEPAEARPMSSLRRAIAARMTKSHREIPRVTLHVDADVTEIERIRRKPLGEEERGLSLTPFLLKAAALGCRAHPLLRSTLEGNEIRTHARVDLGMAVALDAGLLVPVIRGVDELRVEEIAERAGELAHRAREGRLVPSELAGAVFTVTNLGMYGVRSFDPLVDPPQSATLGIGAVRETLILMGGQVASRSLVDLALSFDHRVMDGAQAALALGGIREALECPLRLLRS